MRRVGIDRYQEATANWSDGNEAGELRRYAAEAIERLSDDHDVLLSVARSCIQDQYWKCRMVGLGLIEQIGERGRELVQFVQPLVKDELPEIRRTDRERLEAVRGTFRTMKQLF